MSGLIADTFNRHLNSQNGSMPITFHIKLKEDGARILYLVGSWPSKITIAREFLGYEDSGLFISPLMVGISVANGYAEYHMIQETDHGEFEYELVKGERSDPRE